MNLKKYQSEALEVLYEDALADFRLGIISEERMKFYEHECIVPEVPHVSFSANDVPHRHLSPVAARSVRK